MSKDSKDKALQATRRDLLRGAGLAGVAAAAGSGAAQAQVAAKPRQALETLTVAEADTLDAVCARLIPSDATGPGAAEAHASAYIDRALSGFMASSRETYRSGLTALDVYAQGTHGMPFSRLPPADQDAALTALEAGHVPDAPNGFFALVRTHTIQGTFCDPYYGGNANFIGWDLIGYPGLRMAVGPAQQLMDPKLKPTHQSAYDFNQFNRVGASAPAMSMAAMPGMDMRHDD